jgi:hypothetical protein
MLDFQGVIFKIYFPMCTSICYFQEYNIVQIYAPGCNEDDISFPSMNRRILLLWTNSHGTQLTIFRSTIENTNITRFGSFTDLMLIGSK